MVNDGRQEGQWTQPSYSEKYRSMYGDEYHQNEEPTKPKRLIWTRLAFFSLMPLVVLLAVLYIAMNGSGFQNLDTYRIVLIFIYIFLILAWVTNLVSVFSCLTDKRATGYEVVVTIFQALFLFASVTPLTTLWKSIIIDLSHFTIFLSDRFYQMMMLYTFVTAILAILWQIISRFMFKDELLIQNKYYDK